MMRTINRLGLIGCLFSLVITQKTIAQSENIEPAGAPSAENYPEVGKPCPDFLLDSITHYKTTKATLKDFRGKWLLLDFWSRYCSGCVASFPRVNKMQHELSDKLQVMLVGVTGSFYDKDKVLKKMYEKFRESENLSMPCAYDSSLYEKMSGIYMPYSILVDDNGIVRAVTNGISLENVKSFMAGNKPYVHSVAYSERKEDPRMPLDYMKPYLINDNGGQQDDFVYRSLITKYKISKQNNFFPQSINRHDFIKGQFQTMGVPLNSLYNYAFFGIAHWGMYDSAFYGHFYSRPIPEMQDSTQFTPSFGGDGKNLFSYSLILRDSNINEIRMREIMKKDLEAYFDYTASIETRECPYLKVTADKKTKDRLRTKGGEQIFTSGIPKVVTRFQNVPISTVIGLLSYAAWEYDLYVDDQTGIDFNVDIDMNCIAVSTDDIVKALVRNGFKVELTKKPMKAIVVKDKNYSSVANEVPAHKHY